MYVSSTAHMSLFPAKLCLEQIVWVDTGSRTLVLKLLLLPFHTTATNTGLIISCFILQSKIGNCVPSSVVHMTRFQLSLE